MILPTPVLRHCTEWPCNRRGTCKRCELAPRTRAPPLSWPMTATTPARCNLPGSQEHPAHGALHRAVADAVQGPGGTERGLCFFGAASVFGDESAGFAQKRPPVVFTVDRPALY